MDIYPNGQMDKVFFLMDLYEFLAVFVENPNKFRTFTGYRKKLNVSLVQLKLEDEYAP